MATKRLHQPDINGTHAPVGAPLSAEAVEIFREWTSQGHLFAPNTSFVFKKIERNIKKLANAPYICELGVAVYEPDGETLLLYHALNPAERDAIAGTFKQEGLSFQTAAFCPRSEGTLHHGMHVFMYPETPESLRDRLLGRHHAIEKQTTDYLEFAEWVVSSEFGLLEWKARDAHEIDGFAELHQSNDSSGMFFITPQGVDKGTTFRELIDLRYKHIPVEKISIAGDSKPTDGPLFQIPDITHIAVGDPSLLQGVTGRNVYFQSPDEANRYIRSLLKHQVASMERQRASGDQR